VRLPVFAIEGLKAQGRVQQDERLLAGSRRVESGLVFTSSVGTPLDERNVRRVFKA
jgi:hypothetical protein